MKKTNNKTKKWAKYLKGHPLREDTHMAKKQVKNVQHHESSAK